MFTRNANCLTAALTVAILLSACKDNRQPTPPPAQPAPPPTIQTQTTPPPDTKTTDQTPTPPQTPKQQSNNTVKIGVLTDMTGIYAGNHGQGSVLAAKMAIEDFGGTVLGKPIELVAEDHKNQADVAANVAQKWYGPENVDVIVDLPHSGCALAVLQTAKKMNRTVLVSGAGTTNITNENRTPNSIHWTYDTYSNSYVPGTVVMKQGGDSWFFITADNPFGLSFERDATEIITERGGKVIGSLRHPFAVLDFSSHLLKAKNSGAKVIALASAGVDKINQVKQAKKFGITDSQTLVCLYLDINEIHEAGLDAAQGLLSTCAFYWDMNDETRAFANRFFAVRNAMPNQLQNGIYSSILHYLKAVKEAGTDDPATVMAMMKKLPVNDIFVKNGSIREDGRMIHDMFLVQVKTPAESKKPWDYYKILQTVPGNEAFRPLDKGRLPPTEK